MTRDEAALEMVEWHWEIDREMTRAIRLLTPDEDDPLAPINFLEVSTGTSPSGDVMTFTFGGTKELPFRMRIANITPEEMEQVERGEIPLPEGWDLKHSVEYPAPARRSLEARRWRRSRETVRLMGVPSGRHKPFSLSRTPSETRSRVPTQSRAGLITPSTVST